MKTRSRQHGWLDAQKGLRGRWGPVASRSDMEFTAGRSDSMLSLRSSSAMQETSGLGPRRNQFPRQRVSTVIAMSLETCEPYLGDLRLAFRPLQARQPAVPARLMPRCGSFA